MMNVPDSRMDMPKSELRKLKHRERDELIFQFGNGVDVILEIGGWPHDVFGKIW